jgi:hypothetical protein
MASHYKSCDTTVTTTVAGVKYTFALANMVMRVDYVDTYGSDRYGVQDVTITGRMVGPAVAESGGKVTTEPAATVLKRLVHIDTGES